MHIPLGSHFIDEGLLQRFNPVLNIVQLETWRLKATEGSLGVPSSFIEMSITTAKVQAFQNPVPVMLTAVSEHHIETPRSVPFLFSPPSHPESEVPKLAAALIMSLNAAEL